jgi:N-acetylglucosaminyldiphosphoundecaprenol N-acetyl-beta-D-mannosaminyltransferase
LEGAALQDLAQQLRRAQPDIVFVALGSPKQEQVIEALRDCVPGAWWLGVGITFSFLCGHVRRAPRWMQRAGLEWVHRLLQEPRRLAGRYLLKGLLFAFVLFTTAAWARIRPPRAQVA